MLPGPETLGALLRGTAGALLDSPALHTSLVYTERATYLPAEGDGAMSIEQREYRADVEEHGGRALARLSASLQDGSELRVIVISDGEHSWYVIPDGRTGRFWSLTDVFSLINYERQLALVPLRGAEVLTGKPTGNGTVRIEVALSPEAFALLLRITGADAPSSAEDMGFLSHRVEVLRHRGELRLRCAWTAFGVDERAPGDDRTRMVTRIRCAIQVTCGPGDASLPILPPAVVEGTPELEGFDELWRMLRAPAPVEPAPSARPGRRRGGRGAARPRGGGRPAA